MPSPKQYDTRDQATAAWVRWAKGSGLVQVLGGGWWQVQGWRRPLQGLDALGAGLERRGLLRQVPARDQGAQATGVWAWELGPAAPAAPQAPALNHCRACGTPIEGWATRCLACGGEPPAPGAPGGAPTDDHDHDTHDHEED